MSVEMANSVGLNEVQFLGGSKVYAVEEEITDQTDPVADHETAHVYAALEEEVPILVASIVPNREQGSLGHVITGEANGKVAIAAKALGHSGTGHDEAVSAKLGNSGADAAAISAKLHPRKREMKRFSLALTQEKEMPGGRVYHVANEIKTTKPVKVFLEHSDGTKHTERVMARNDRVPISDSWYPPYYKNNPFVNRS